jgi:hypothetical protein
MTTSCLATAPEATRFFFRKKSLELTHRCWPWRCAALKLSSRVAELTDSCVELPCLPLRDWPWDPREQRFRMWCGCASVEVLQDPARVQVDKPVDQSCLASLSRVCAQHDPLLPELICAICLEFEGLALLIRSSVFARHFFAGAGVPGRTFLKLEQGLSPARPSPEACGGPFWQLQQGLCPARPIF